MLTITQRQQNLRTWFYYYKDKIDGIEGNNTISAYKNFQRDNGLIVDGIYGVNTNNALINNVKAMQSKLNNHGYGLAVDGIVGDNTLNALKDFQGKSGLIIDGLCGPETWNKLNNSSPVVDKTATQEDWKKSKYLNENEITCECGCGEKRIYKTMIEAFNITREHFGVPGTITSGCRCVTQNKRDEGMSNSSHLPITHAIDVYFAGMGSYESRKRIIDYFIDNVPNAYFAYCDGYWRLKNGYTKYDSYPKMGNAIHIEVYE